MQISTKLCIYIQLHTFNFIHTKTGSVTCSWPIVGKWKANAGI